MEQQKKKKGDSSYRGASVMFLYINGKFTMEKFKYESGDHLRSVTGKISI
jgi:hypothetical protein